MGALAPGSVGDSAASSPPGVGVAGSSQSRESLVLTAPSSVASSAPSAERNCRSRSRVAGGSTEARSCCRSSLSHGGESCGERRCARSRSGGSRARSRKLRSCSTTRSQTHGRGALDGIRHALPLPMCGPGRGLQTATGLAEFACALGVAVRSLDECVRALLAVTRPGVTVRGHTGPVTGHVTVAGHGIGPFSPLTVRGRGRGAGVQGGVPWIAWRLFLPPGIAATLGRGWSLPLQWRAAPPLCPRLLCRTSPGCSSACRGSLLRGMQLGGLCFRLRVSPVLGRCLVLLLR